MWLVVWIIVIVLATVFILCRNIDDRRNANFETNHFTMRSGQDVTESGAPLPTTKTSTENKAEIVMSAKPAHESESEIELKAIVRTEEKRQEVATEAGLRRLDLLSLVLSSASTNPEDLDPSVDLSSDLFIERSVFENQAAPVIANMPAQGAELLALTSATNEDELPHHTRQEASPVSNWSKNEGEKIADLERFDKQDRKAAALVEKVIEISEGEFQPKVLFNIHKGIAPSQSRLMLQKEQK